ncbi:MAG: hypothetical protein AAF483_00255 [Planctomycetota bacterium]
MIYPSRRIRNRFNLTLFAFAVYGSLLLPSSSAQEIKYEDRIGSNKDFDMCEDFRFKRITKLVQEKKISQQQGYNIWKRVRSDKEATEKALAAAVEAKELTQDQADRLLPLVDMEMKYFESRHGLFGKPKELVDGRFEVGEVSAENRAAIYQRLIAANERGDMYDYDVASIMNQLYAGFDEQTASVEEVANYRTALNPRIAQSGSEQRVFQNAKMQRKGSASSAYDVQQIKIADPAEWTKNLEAPIYSGPQPGEKVPSLTLVNLRGKAAGQEFDPLDLAGDKLHLMVFARKSRTFGRFLGHLANQLQAIGESSKQPWAMSVIVCTDDANEAEKSFTVLDERYPEHLMVGLSKDGAAGPPAYGLDKNITATVIVVKKGRVAYNLPYAGDAFYTQPHILGAVAQAMEVDHDTLRKYIGSVPGDAAIMAATLKKQSANMAFPPQQGFRRKLAPLVSAAKLTRAESAEIYKVSGDAKTLRRKVEELVKAEKLTREEADSLLDLQR